MPFGTQTITLITIILQYSRHQSQTQSVVLAPRKSRTAVSTKELLACFSIHRSRERERERRGLWQRGRERRGLFLKGNYWIMMIFFWLFSFFLSKAVFLSRDATQRHNDTAWLWIPHSVSIYTPLAPVASEPTLCQAAAGKLSDPTACWGCWEGTCWRKWGRHSAQD